MFKDDEALSRKMLIREVSTYMHDAGFNEDRYSIVEYYGRDYVEIVGLDEGGIQFILKDVEKTGWNDVISLKYCQCDTEYGTEISVIAMFT